MQWKRALTIETIRVWIKGNSIIYLPPMGKDKGVAILTRKLNKYRNWVNKC